MAIFLVGFAQLRPAAVVAQTRPDGEEVHATLPGLRVQAPAPGIMGF